MNKNTVMKYRLLYHSVPVHVETVSTACIFVSMAAARPVPGSASHNAFDLSADCDDVDRGLPQILMRSAAGYLATHLRQILLPSQHLQQCQDPKAP